MVSGGGGALYDITMGPDLPGPQSPGAREQTSKQGAISSQLTMWSHKWFLCLSVGVTCLRLMFTSLRQKAEELQGKVLCGGHFLIWQNLPEHAQDCLEITLLWLFFIVLMYFNSEVGRRTWPE